jgi:hypothetical protein
MGVANDGAGHLFIADSYNHTVRQIVIATGVVTTFAGTAGESGISDGTGTDARFSGPAGITSDGAGNLFVADNGNHTIRKIVIATGVVTTFAGSPGAAGSTDGTGTDARFYLPIDLTSDGAGNIFVVSSQAIRQIAIATGIVTTLAGSSAGASGSSDGTGTAASFNGPKSAASDGAGNLFVADSLNHTIRKIVIATGVVTTFAGSSGLSSSTDGTGTNARFNYPVHVTSDNAGNLFVSDHTNNTGLNQLGGTVRKIVISTRAVTTVVGSPNRFGIVLGPLPAQLTAPAGLAFVPPAQLFITDTAENVVLVAQF